MMRPKKSLGQNFLIDSNYKRKILQTLDLKATDFVLEIGPGQGALTHELVKRCSQLWLIEKDTGLAAALQETYKHLVHVHVLQADALEISFLNFFRTIQQKIKVVGNLPYNVASQIFIRLMEHPSLFSDLFLMFQKEMALRFVAAPSTKDYGLLTLWAQVYSDCEILFHLPPTVFFPKPKVVSSFVHFKMKQNPVLNDHEARSFFELMHQIFSQRRKTIRRAFKNFGIPGYESFEKRYPSNTRAETLSLHELTKIWQGVRGGAIISPFVLQETVINK